MQSATDNRPGLPIRATSFCDSDLTKQGAAPSGYLFESWPGSGSASLELQPGGTWRVHLDPAASPSTATNARPMARAIRVAHERSYPNVNAYALAPGSRKVIARLEHERRLGPWDGGRGSDDRGLVLLYGPVADQHGHDCEGYDEPYGCSEVDGGDDHQSVEQSDQGEPEVVDVSGRSGAVIVGGEARGVPGAEHHVEGKPDQRTEHDLGGAGYVRPVCRHGCDHEHGHGHEQADQRRQVHRWLSARRGSMAATPTANAPRAAAACSTIISSHIARHQP
jgi:hypothetical protein